MMTGYICMFLSSCTEAAFTLGGWSRHHQGERNMVMFRGQLAHRGPQSPLQLKPSLTGLRALERPLFTDTPSLLVLIQVTR